MKEIKEALQNRLKEHRQNVAGNWSSLIIKIALLVLLIWLIANYRNGYDKYLGKYMQHKQKSEQSKETP